MSEYSNFQEWVVSLRTLVVLKFVSGDTSWIVGDEDHWRCYYETGYTPTEALEDELSYWIEV